MESVPHGKTGEDPELVGFLKGKATESNGRQCDLRRFPILRNKVNKAIYVFGIWAKR